MMPVREFARYLNRNGEAAYILPPDIARKDAPYAPYIYTEAEILAIWDVFDHLKPRGGFPVRQFVIPAMIKLMYCCGLRPSEARRLHVDDVDLDIGRLNIMESKQHRSRMEKFPRWRKALRANKAVVISDLQRLEKVYPDEAAFFREYGVTTLLAAPFSKRINQGFIAVDDPTRYTDDPVFLFIASYAVVVELNEIKQQQSLLAATKASKYNPEDIHVNFFGGMEIISSKGTLTGEDIKADQCYLLLAYLILNHKKNFTVDTLAEIICPYDELDSPYKVVNNIVYRLRRTLSVIGLDKLVIGKNGIFQINPNFNIHTDFDRFEDACIQLKTEENPDMRHF